LYKEELSSPEVFAADEQSLSDNGVLQEEIKGVLVSEKKLYHW